MKIDKKNFLILLTENGLFLPYTNFAPKGQLISKANCQAVNSSKKRTNELVFTTMRCVFVHFLEEIEATKKAFRN